MTVVRVTQGGLEVLALNDPNLIITQAGLEVLTLSDPNLIITQAGLEVLEDRQGPYQPTVTASNPTTTTIDLVGSAFDQFSGSSAVHSQTQWFILDLNTGLVVYDSGAGSDLLAHTCPVDSLAGNTDHYAVAAYKNGDNQWSWTGPVSNTVRTLSSPVSGGAAIEFWTGDDDGPIALISRHLAPSTTDTDYGDWLRDENIPIPATTRYIIPVAWKEGSDTDDVRIKEMQIDKGRLSGGYHPTGFRPELHDEISIPFAGTDMGDQTAAFEVDWAQGTVVMVEISDDLTMTWSNLQPFGRYYLQVKQGTGGSRLLTWPAAANFAGGSTPTLSTAVGAIDWFMLVVSDSPSVVMVQTMGLDVK